MVRFCERRVRVILCSFPNLKRAELFYLAEIQPRTEEFSVIEECATGVVDFSITENGGGRGCIYFSFHLGKSNRLMTSNEWQKPQFVGYITEQPALFYS